MSKRIGLVPAYGRDYKNVKTLKQDFFDGKDFIISDVTHRYYGKPASIQELKADKYKHVQIRYSKLAKVAVFEL